MTTKHAFFPARRIGIISGSEVIGDGLLKIPFLRALRIVWPEARIHWITSKGPTVYSDVLHDTVATLIDEIHVLPAWLTDSNAGEHAPPFDLIIDTRGRWQVALSARRHLPHKLFIAPAVRYLFSDRRPPLFAPRPEQNIARLLQAIELAAGYQPRVTGSLATPPDLLAKARRILPEGRVYIGLAPGAGKAVKKWPVENFANVARLQASMNRVPVFILGPKELDLHDDLSRAVPAAIFPLQAAEVWGSEQPSVEQTLALSRCLDLAVTNDSGTSHMLVAVDCPLVSLFGPTRARKLAPRVSQSTVICAQDFGSSEMSAIPVEAVNEAVNRTISLQGIH